MAADEARKINIVTISSIVVALFMPGYSLIVLAATRETGFAPLPVLTPLAISLLYSVPLVLIHHGRGTAAKVVFYLLVNAQTAVMTKVYGFEVGTGHFLFALGLVPFLIFRGAKPFWLGCMLLLPLALYFVARTSFHAPIGGQYLVPASVIQQSNTFNLIVAYAVTVLVVYLFYNMLSEAQIQLEQFSVGVSEYLDADLVARIRDGVDLSPRIAVLTVFVADLIGSTRTSFMMNETAYGAMINRYVQEMQDIIKSHRGFIEDVSGDGILGYVGNFDSAGPAKDAIDAVELCVHMRARLAQLVPVFQATHGLPSDLGVRIGICSGEATVGKTAGARAIYTANGESMNLAAKLEKKVAEVAPAGGILISRATADLVGDRFELTPYSLDIEGSRIEAYLVQDAAVLRSTRNGRS